MINYSIYQSSFVFSEWDDFQPEYDEVTLNNSISLVIEYCNQDSFKIIRLLSTDPADYLKSEFEPGSIHNNYEIR